MSGVAESCGNSAFWALCFSSEPGEIGMCGSHEVLDLPGSGCSGEYFTKNLPALVKVSSGKHVGFWAIWFGFPSLAPSLNFLNFKMGITILNHKGLIIWRAKRETTILVKNSFLILQKLFRKIQNRWYFLNLIEKISFKPREIFKNETLAVSH